MSSSATRNKVPPSPAAETLRLDSKHKYRLLFFINIILHIDLITARNGNFFFLIFRVKKMWMER